MMSFARSFFYCLLFCACVLPTQAQEYPFKRIEDRKEGIVKGRQLVSGEKINLVAARIRHVADGKATAGNTYQINFCSPGSSNMRVMVQSFEERYKMEPLNNEYEAGNSEYKWPDTIAKYYNLHPGNLYPLVSWYAEGKSRVAPVEVSAGSSETDSLVYEMYFVAHKSARNISYKIYNPVNLDTLSSGELGDVEKHELFGVAWNGRDKQGNKQATGYYEMVVTGEFKSVATGAFEVKDKVIFYHCNEENE